MKEDNKNKRGNKYKAVRLKDLVVLAMIFIFTISVIWVVNGSILKNFYLNKRIKAMEDAYLKINEATNIGTLNSEEFDITFRSIVEKNNMNILVLDTETETIRASSRDYERLTNTLLGYVFNRSVSERDVIIKNTEKYEIHRTKESISHMEYIDLWGILDNGYLFLVRCPLESIREATRISGSFFTLIIIIISTLIAISVLLQSRHTVIVELKKKNDELKKDIEQKEELEKMRSEFLSNVSHELKTPIALIQGYAEGLSEYIDEDIQTREYYCEVIVDEASKMNNIVKKLLDINHLEFGDIEFEVNEFDIVEMINNYIQSAQILIDSKNVNININTQSCIMVMSDEYYIEEVFGNYFTNALNHVKYENKIDINIDETIDKVIISVFNTGDPIPKESVEHLFEKFYKVDKARTREYGGSGVGLSIVKAIMDQMGEDYGVVNYNDGVKFYFSVKKKKEIDDAGT